MKLWSAQIWITGILLIVGSHHNAEALFQTSYVDLFAIITSAPYKKNDTNGGITSTTPHLSTHKTRSARVSHSIADETPADQFDIPIATKINPTSLNPIVKSMEDSTQTPQPTKKKKCRRKRRTRVPAPSTKPKCSPKPTTPHVTQDSPSLPGDTQEQPPSQTKKKCSPKPTTIPPTPDSIISDSPTVSKKKCSPKPTTNPPAPPTPPASSKKKCSPKPTTTKTGNNPSMPTPPPTNVKCGGFWASCDRGERCTIGSKCDGGVCRPNRVGYEQCGGEGWFDASICGDNLGWTCKYHGPYYSQCIPLSTPSCI